MKKIIAAFALSAMAATASSAGTLTAPTDDSEVTPPPVLKNTGLSAGATMGIIGGLVLLGVLASDSSETSTTGSPS